MADEAKTYTVYNPIGGDKRTQGNAAAKAKESARNSYQSSGSIEDAALADASPLEIHIPVQSGTRRKLPKRLLQFPQNVQTGRAAPGHHIIFDRIELSAGKGEENDKSITLKSKTKSSRAQITLYMPASVDVSYRSLYSDTAVGIGAEGLGNLVDSITANVDVNKIFNDDNPTSALMKSVQRVGSDMITRQGGTGGDVANQIALNAIAKMVGYFPGMGGADKVAQSKLNKVVTDKMEFFFQGLDRREFKYEFTFIPTSERESKEVNDIIKEFKLAMLPEYTSGLFSEKQSDRTLTVPDLFDIKYMYLDENYQAQRNNYLNRITTCYLTDMSVKYGSDRYTAYRPDEIGAPPQNTSVSLSFTEVEIVTRERARLGF